MLCAVVRVPFADEFEHLLKIAVTVWSSEYAKQVPTLEELIEKSKELRQRHDDITARLPVSAVTGTFIIE